MFALILSRFVISWRAFATRRDLRRLDAHLLRDVGLTPERAGRETTKPFWRS
jgi:uncharacterized protein YjiS (DUF1127 family)